MFPQRLKDGSGVQLAHGPRGHQPSVQGNSIEHSHLRATFNHQSFDHIETIQLAVAQRQRRQIPTRQRCTPSHPSLSVQSASSLQDATKGAKRRRIGQPLGQPLASNGRCAKLTQVAVLAQLVTYPNNPVFFKRRCTTRLMRNRSVCRPIRRVELKPLSPLYPSLNRWQRDVKATGYRAHRLTGSNRFYHRFSSILSGGFLAMKRSPQSNVIDSTDIQVLASTLTLRY